MALRDSLEACEHHGTTRIRHGPVFRRRPVLDEARLSRTAAPGQVWEFDGDGAPGQVGYALLLTLRKDEENQDTNGYVCLILLDGTNLSFGPPGRLRTLWLSHSRWEKVA